MKECGAGWCKNPDCGSSGSSEHRNFPSAGGGQLKASEATLRDYFAAKAMAAVIMNPETQHELANMGRDEGMIVISKVAYMQADAMLAERAK